jgi:Mrp family chromosome partitioning ATPase
MELSFIIDSVRRHFWIVVLGGVLGAMAAVLLSGGGPPMYESRAVLLLVPSSGNVLVSISNDSERYVSSQLAVLRSLELTESAAESLGDGTTANEIAGAVRFEHEPETDIVHVLVRTADPGRSQAIGDAVVTAYFDLLAAEPGVANELTRLEQLKAGIEDELQVVDAAIVDAMAPYLGRVGDQAIPPLEQIAPDLLSQKTILLNQHAQIVSAVADLEQESHTGNASRPVQGANRPDDPIPTSKRTMVVVGFVGGGFLGLLAAVLLTQFSSRVLGPRHVEELLGEPLAGTLPVDPALAADGGLAVTGLPGAIAAAVDLVCVRAESSVRPSGVSLVVVVVGTERGAGATTLAGAMANRFATHGGQVLLVDVDARDPELTRHFAAGAPGVPELLALAPTIPDLRDHNDPDLAPILSRTPIPNLRVVGTGPDASASALRRQNVPVLIGTTARIADVVVIDAGPLLEASSSVQLAQLADSVVLAVPSNQDATALEGLRSQLSGRRGTLLAVWTPGTKAGSGPLGLLQRLLARVPRRGVATGDGSVTAPPAEPPFGGPPEPPLVPPIAEDFSEPQRPAPASGPRRP